MSALPLLEVILSTLDGLSTGACLFDTEDRTLSWNRTFLLLFPEHDGGVRVGEPYADNLRCFYAGRLAPPEQHLVEKNVADGVQRHRNQFQPYVFEHLGRSIRVASLPLPGIGRIRLWRDETPRPDLAERVPLHALASGAGLFDLIADGVTVTDKASQIEWVNEPFVRQYRLANRQCSIGCQLRAAIPACVARPRSNRG